MIEQPSRLRPVPDPGAPDPLLPDPPAQQDQPGMGITAPRTRTRGSRFLSDVLVELGILSKERVDAAVEEGRASGRTPEQILLESKAITADQLARAVAERFGLEHVDLTVYQADPTAGNLVSAQAARRYNAVPIGFDPKGILLVAISDPSNVLALDDLKLMTGHDIRPVVASIDDIGDLIGRMNSLEEAVAEATRGDDDDEDDFAAVSEIRESAHDAPVIRLVNSIIAQAAEEGASDIHLEATGRDMRVRFRVDGVLDETATIPRRMIAGVVSRVKIMGDLDISERRIPQDGRANLNVGGREIDVRIVTLPSALGEGVIMRLLDKASVLLDLDALGIREASRERFEESFTRSYGAVLVTGPTGSGKSTTLYTALNALNSVEKKIITIEDPVEYQLPGIIQIGVNNKAGLTFPRGLRAMLRADPDIIMVGEIRDAETARIAMESALTGHLVLSTLHTNDAPSAVSRLTEMGIEPFLTASAVDCVLAQRLARTLCTYCKRRTMVTAAQLNAAGFEAAFDIEAYGPVGCPRCKQSGYKGRIGIYEVMKLSTEIRSLVLERTSADVIRDLAVEQGMRLLRDDGLEKVRLGMTSITELTRVT